MPCLSGSILLVMLICPLCPSTNCFEANNPIPVPTVSRVVEGIKHLWQDARMMPASVRDVENHAGSRTFGIANRNRQRASRGHGINRIRNQVENDLHHLTTMKDTLPRWRKRFLDHYAYSCAARFVDRDGLFHYLFEGGQTRPSVLAVIP